MNFSLLSDKDIDDIAAFDISNEIYSDRNVLHDYRFGSAGSIELECGTCGMRSDVCMGHHASLSLGTSMFHPLVYKQAEYLMNNTCFKCGSRLPAVLKSKSRKCQECGSMNYGNYAISINNLEYAIKKTNDTYLPTKCIPSHVLPDGYIVSKVLVPPIHFRNTEDMEWSSDIQRLYEQLIRPDHTQKILCPSFE